MRIVSSKFLSRRATICAGAAFLVALAALPVIEISRSHAADLAQPSMPNLAPAPIGVAPSPPMPGMPSMPSAGGMPGGMPQAALPGAPSAPGQFASSVPMNTPGMPSMPGMPGASASNGNPVPPMPGMASGGAPNMPGAPTVAGAPAMPSGGVAGQAGLPGAPGVAGALPGAPEASPLIKSATASEDKINDSAKGIMKKLDSTSEAMTLDDLNAAQQTVARIEAMIDVEKHLAELEKVRGERGVSSKAAVPANALANAIPASALAPMPSPMPMASMAPMSPMSNMPAKPIEKEKPKTVMTNLEISRISGANGKYSAVLKMGNGEMKPVRVGDSLSEHATVKWISSSTVLIEENGESHTLHIKNIDAIFSAMR